MNAPSDMESVGRFLPEEILERKILPLLPVASLVRFRAVCKKWNAWVNQREFAAKHALATPLEDYVLITKQQFQPGRSGCRGWDIIDVASNKVFTLSDSFLPAMEGYIQRSVLAADGGLFLVEYMFDSSGKNDVLLVCNPLLKSVKLVPHSSGCAARVEAYDNVLLSTDRVSMEYEIMVLHQHEGGFQTYKVDIYESRTGSWRKVEHATTDRSLEQWWIESKFVKADVFYRLYRHEREVEPDLVLYDKATDGTSELGFQLPVTAVGLVHFELVVSGRRLFYIVKSGFRRNDSRSIELFEIYRVRHDRTVWAEMPSKLLEWLYGDDLDESMTNSVFDRYDKPVVSAGGASSIMIFSCVGRCVVYDLVDESWHQYSDNNLLQASTIPYSEMMLFSSGFCLSLCPP